MRKIYGILIIFFVVIILFSCENEKKISITELNASIKKHKDDQLFLSFYTNMPQSYEDALVESEIIEGKLFKKRKNEIDWIIYPLIYDGSKVADFYFYNMKNKVELLSRDEDTVNYDISNYEYKFQRILNILENKYKQKYKTRQMKYNVVYDSLVLTNKYKVVTIVGSYSNNYNYSTQRIEGGSNIELSYYTKNSFGKELKEIRDRQLDNEYWKNKKNEEINKNNKKTIKDL